MEPTALFQDDLHTNVAGAAHYANVIATELAKICANYNWAEVKKDKMISNRRIVEVKMPKSERCLGIKVGINLTGSNTEVNVRIIQVQLIGTFSPIIRSTHADSSSERSIWDRYCHRDRPSFVMLFDGALKESSIIDITVSRKDPAYSRPRPDGLPWPDADNRYMTTLGKIYVIASDDIEAEVCS